MRASKCQISKLKAMSFSNLSPELRFTFESIPFCGVDKTRPFLLGHIRLCQTRFIPAGDENDICIIFFFLS